MYSLANDWPMISWGLEPQCKPCLLTSSKIINDFIVSVIDVYSQPQNDMSDIMSKYGMDDILKHVQRKGLKPLKRAV